MPGGLRRGFRDQPIPIERRGDDGGRITEVRGPALDELDIFEVILRRVNRLVQARQRPDGGVFRAIDLAAAREVHEEEMEERLILDRPRMHEQALREIVLQLEAQRGIDQRGEGLLPREIGGVRMIGIRGGKEPGGETEIATRLPRATSPREASFCVMMSGVVPGLPTWKTENPVGKCSEEDAGLAGHRPGELGAAVERQNVRPLEAALLQREALVLQVLDVADARTVVLRMLQRLGEVRQQRGEPLPLGALAPPTEAERGDDQEQKARPAPP